METRNAKVQPSAASLDAVLATYERRAPTIGADEAAKRRAGLDLGWELNRLQGGERTAADRRLGDLYATGRISRDEYADLSAQLAQQGLFMDAEVAMDER